MGILRLAHVDVRTPDLELSTAYYTEVMGLQQVQRTDDAVYLKCWDEEDHHSLRMRYDPRTGMDSFTFRVEDEDDLARASRSRSRRYGCPRQRVSRGEAVGQGESIRFEVPSGQIMELVWDIEKTGNILGKHNPSPVPPPDLPGIAPPRMDHMLVNAEEVGEAARVLHRRARLADDRAGARRQRPPARRVARGRTHSPHDIAIVNGPNGALHHWAYWLDDWDHVRKAADTLAYNGVQIDQGPTRHGVTRGNTIYFFDPLGIRNEVFTGGYWVGPGPRDHHLDRGRVRQGPLLLRERHQPAVPADAHLRGARRAMPDRILRLQHVEVRVPDLELCTAYYTEVLGLIETARDERDGAAGLPQVLGRARAPLGDPAPGPDLRPRPHVVQGHRGLDDLDHFTERARGAPASRSSGTRPRELGPGWGEAIRFEAPSGPPGRAGARHGAGRQHAAADQPAAAAAGPGRHRAAAAGPRVRHGRGRRGVHARSSPSVLEFRLTEQILANDGHQLATFLERSHTPHDIAVITGPNGALHHFAFWLDDWNAHPRGRRHAGLPRRARSTWRPPGTA